MPEKKEDGMKAEGGDRYTKTPKPIYVSRSAIGAGVTTVEYDYNALEVGDTVTHKTKDGEIVSIIEVCE